MPFDFKIVKTRALSYKCYGCGFLCLKKLDSGFAEIDFAIPVC